MIVKNIGRGVLVDDKSRKYMADVDGEGHVMDVETGEIFEIVKEERGRIYIQ